MRTFTVKAKTLESAQSLFNALRRFDPALEGSASEGYSVSVDVGANDRRLLDVLEAIHQHVQERDDPARVELDGRDNSLIKGIPRSLSVRNASNRLVDNGRIGTGFVAAHVWRRLSDGSDAPRNPMTYSFLPNLVWLPAQLAKLTDREGGFAQTLLQAISLALYRDVALSPRLAAFVDPVWDALPVRDEVAEIEVPLDRLNLFAFDHAWLERRRRTLSTVEESLAAVGTGGPATSKVVSSRYGDGLNALDRAAVAHLHESLSSYREAIDEARDALS
jgi:hypothetical protein